MSPLRSEAVQGRAAHRAGVDVIALHRRRQRLEKAGGVEGPHFEDRCHHHVGRDAAGELRQQLVEVLAPGGRFLGDADVVLLFNQGDAGRDQLAPPVAQPQLDSFIHRLLGHLASGGGVAGRHCTRGQCGPGRAHR